MSKVLFQNTTARQLNDDLTVNVNMRIETSDANDKTFDILRFYILPDVNGSNSGAGAVKLYPSDFISADWLRLREVNLTLEKFCRFQQAAVSNRMAEMIPLQMGLRPISALDFLLPKRSFFFGTETFLKTIGYGVLDIDREVIAQEEVEEIYKEFFPFDMVEFQLEFDDIWQQKQETETSRHLVRRIESLKTKIGKELFFHINKAALDHTNTLLAERVESLNHQLRSVIDHLSFVLHHRQGQLIKFWLEKADEYFGKDIRNYLK
jgi:hypothetical protein